LLFGDETWAAVAWIRGAPPRLPGLERLTVSEVFRTVGLEPPKTSTAGPRDRGVSVWVGLLAGLAAFALVTPFGLARRNRRPFEADRRVESDTLAR
jgi:hypothetical protein